jgi:hypothetical protein
MSPAAVGNGTRVRFRAVSAFEHPACSSAHGLRSHRALAYCEGCASFVGLELFLRSTMQAFHSLRSSLVSRHGQPRASRGKRGHPKRKDAFRPRTVGITAPGVDRVVADKAEPIARACKGSPLGF